MKLRVRPKKWWKAYQHYSRISSYLSLIPFIELAVLYYTIKKLLLKP